MLWVVAMPISISMVLLPVDFTFLHYIGIFIWVVGFSLEVISDRQLDKFKKNISCPGQVCDLGLWGYSRHPNYFGEALLWWGFFVYTFSTTTPYTLVSPILMTWLLRYFTGIAPLEEDMLARKKGYRAYMDRVPVFCPWLK